MRRAWVGIPTVCTFLYSCIGRKAHHKEVLHATYPVSAEQYKVAFADLQSPPQAMDPRQKPDVNVNHHHVAGQPAGGLNTGSGHVHVNIYLSPMNHLGQMQNQQFPDVIVDGQQAGQGGPPRGGPQGGDHQGDGPPSGGPQGGDHQGGGPRGGGPQGQLKTVAKPKQNTAPKPMEKKDLAKDLAKQFAAARKRGRPKKEVQLYTAVCEYIHECL